MVTVFPEMPELYFAVHSLANDVPAFAALPFESHRYTLQLDTLGFV